MSTRNTIDYPDRVDTAATTTADRVIENAPTEGETLALVSGGHDSLTAMDIIRRSDHPLNGIIHINTGFGIPETHKFVKQRAADLDIPYHEVGREESNGGGHEYRPLNEEYRALVRKHGFPGPPIHKIMYLALKQKPLKRFLSERDGPITLVSGVRKHESSRRMENVDSEGISEYLGHTTLSPIVDFTALDVQRYRTGLALPENPVKVNLELSGDCLCGAYASRKELRMIRLFYPETYRRILYLEAMVSAASYSEDGPDEEFTHWGHNRLKQREIAVLDDDDQMLLCQSCERDCDADDS